MGNMKKITISILLLFLLNLSKLIAHAGCLVENAQDKHHIVSPKKSPAQPDKVKVKDYVGEIQKVPSSIKELMVGKSWKEGCPVPMSDLRYLTMSYWGYDDMPHIGHMITHVKIAHDVVDIFAEMFEAKFPIERMEIVDLYDADDDRSMAANNTSCFCYRKNTTFPNLVSNHGWGLAVDINPKVNPYVKGSKILPPNGMEFADRSKIYKGGIYATLDNACYQAFIKRGFHWGGIWPDRQDYQHFAKNPEDVGLVASN